MHIAFVTGGLPFNGDSLENQSLGGSETALICVSRELAKRGHSVRVFCDTEVEGEFGGVLYTHRSRFPQMALTLTWDVLVVSRFYDYLRVPSFAGLRVLWMHDVLTNKENLMASLYQTDKVFALSDYHIDNYTNGPKETHLPDLRPHIWKTSNGVDLDLIEANRREKEPKKLIYTSRPERGLHHLLGEIFPRLLEDDPELLLCYASYDISQLPNVDESVKQIIAYCEEQAQRLGDRVINLGHLTKAELYQHISSAELQLYPTAFPEISCCAMMEAQACGTPVVTTRDFALTETVEDTKTGVLIDGRPGTEEYTQRFVSATQHLLKKDKKRRKMGKAGTQSVRRRGLTWNQVAKSWEKKFEEMFEERLQQSGHKIVKELERNSDLVAAKHMASQLGLEEEEKRLDSLIDGAEFWDPRSTEEVTTAFRQAVPRFEKVLKLIHQSGRENPKTVLDYKATDASFGLFYAKAVQDSQVTLFTEDEDVAERLESYAQSSGLGDRVTVRTDAPQGPFDFVFLNEIPQQSATPEHYFQRAATLGSLIGFSLESGPQQATPPEKHRRLWNLSIQDLTELFNGEPANLTFHEEGVSSGGDLQSHWIGIVGSDVNFQPLKQHVVRRKTTVRPYQSLSACLIARDAEDTILRTLKSIRPVCDKIVVAMDDRTTDSTEFIAADYVDEFRYTTFDNFSQMRNESVRDVDTDWIFWIDTDEVLVDAPRMRRYMQSPIFNGMAIRQNHLMLDVHGTYDTPIRLYRNKPEYQFVGYIHEHCEDVSEGGFGNPIRPTLLFPDVDIAHYGYPNESRRRHKCSNRNMELLIRDAKDNAPRGRMLTWLLVMRDYLNIAKWRLQKKKTPVQRTSLEKELLDAAVRVYLEHFSDEKSQYHKLAWDQYQEALAILGNSGVGFQDRKIPPFQVKMALAGAVGGLSEGQLEPDSVWFINDEQYLAYVAQRSGVLAYRAGVASRDKVLPLLEGRAQVEYTWNEHDIDLLKLGLNAINEHTGTYEL